MLGRTHIAVGIASTLVITQPSTITGMVAAMAGGAIGGWLPDIDLVGNKKNDDNDDNEEDPLIDREQAVDLIINALFVGVIFGLDYLLGDGICQYIVDNWGQIVWCAVLAIIVVLFLGIKSAHRSFTHSVLGVVAFCLPVLYLCQPLFVPFSIGYVSHLAVDFFNKKGLRLFFPFRKRLCLRRCYSNQKANRILFWLAFGVSIIAGSILLSSSVQISWDSNEFLKAIVKDRFFGINYFQVYLVLINILSFLAFQRNWSLSTADNEGEEVDTIGESYLTLQTWVSNILVVIGGGVGMLLSLIIHFQLPTAINGYWWNLCYTCVAVWFTVYCMACNPFGHSASEITWVTERHIEILLYLVGINIISGLICYLVRNRLPDDVSLIHTLIFLVGALGGTIGAIIVVVTTHHETKYFYASGGFMMMLVGQIMVLYYLLSVGAV